MPEDGQGFLPMIPHFLLFYHKIGLETSQVLNQSNNQNHKNQFAY